MDRFLHLNLSFLRCRTLRTVLALLWIVGLLLGAVVSLSADTLLSSTMRSALHSGMSIFGLLAALLLPFLITALAVFISQPSLLLPVAFLKAFLFSFTGTGLLTAFGTSAWLLRCLLMFSDTLVLPLLWWLWLRLLSDDRNTALYSCLFAVAGTVLIGCFDFALVSPFLVSLI